MDDESNYVLHLVHDVNAILYTAKRNKGRGFDIIKTCYSREADQYLCDQSESILVQESAFCLFSLKESVYMV
jgi:hypothetical protein